jgi:hypothetical protein
LIVGIGTASIGTALVATDLVAKTLTRIIILSILGDDFSVSE